ncbi:MAG: 50S ribosome-binding GTPase, partial [Candidatus Dormibacteraeota bacterium]|nr:50S ribosome-binding GTPase [Candidatus Dormibacteraeota bacterium]
MARPLVALVGRPNTGKSTLFNRLVGWRQAIVDKEPGLTRDRLYGTTDWEGREMTVIDTAGLDVVEGSHASDPAEQTRLAIEQADVIVLLLDARQGLTPIDRDIAGLLRRSGSQVVVAANKADQHGQPYLQHELYELG